MKVGSSRRGNLEVVGTLEEQVCGAGWRGCEVVGRKEEGNVLGVAGEMGQMEYFWGRKKRCVCVCV